MEELISVIVPVYKVEKYIRKCVDSICSQTYHRLEIILVDDGSPDRCGEICDEYAAKDSRIKVIHKKNGGLSDARNAGLEAATGKYIGFVDSDDYIKPEMYESMLCKMRSEKADLVICNLLYVDEQGEILTEKQKSMSGKDRLMTGKEAMEQLMGTNLAPFIIAPNKLYKAGLFDRIRFPAGRIHEDEFVIHHIFWRCRRVYFQGEPQYCYVQRPGSIMTGKATVKRLDGAEALLDRTQFALEKDMDGLASFSCRQALDIIAEVYRNLDRKAPADSAKITELRRRVIRFYPKILFSKSSIMGKLMLTFFIPHIKCYLFAKDIWTKSGFDKYRKSNRSGKAVK